MTLHSLEGLDSYWDFFPSIDLHAHLEAKARQGKPENEIDKTHKMEEYWDAITVPKGRLHVQTAE